MSNYEKDGSCGTGGSAKKDESCGTSSKSSNQNQKPGASQQPAKKAQ